MRLVIAKMQDMGTVNMSIDAMTCEAQVSWWDSDLSKWQIKEVKAKTLPEAVCLAALATLEKMT